jgi:hypothetical protein
LRALAAAAVLTFRPTLRDVARASLRQHWSANAAARELRYGPLRSFLAAVRRHPGLSAAAVSGFYGGAVLVGLTVPAPRWAPTASVMDPFRDLAAVNLALLGTQATLLGLVYPLVIALVGLLFEARSTPGGRMQTFFQETEALAAGGMALAFLVWVALQSLMYSVTPQNVLVLATALNIAWFAANVLALGFFVLRSLEFIRPGPRHALIKSYLANTAWRGELLRAILLHRWLNAAELGDLPPLIGADRNYVSLFSESEGVVERRLKPGSELVDVRFGWLWAFLARADSRSKLRFPVLPGYLHGGQIVIARGDGIELTTLERLVVGAAFSFAPRPRHPPPTSAAILSEAVGDLLFLRSANRYEEFAAQFDNTLDMHGLLYALAQSPESDAQGPLSWSEALGDRPLGPSIASEWCRVYVVLLQSVADQLDRDRRFFAACAQLAARILHRSPDVRAEALDVLFDLPQVLLISLVDGVSRRRLEATSSAPARGILFEPVGEDAAFYRRAWLDFVGAWGGLGNAVLDEVRGGDWDAFSRRLPLVKRHLRDTALMAARAAKAGERRAIGWTVDMLLKWHGQFESSWSVQPHYAMLRPVVTVSLLDRSQEALPEIPIMQPGAPADPRGVIAAAIENLWTDTLSVLACSLIGLMGEASGSGLIEDGPSEAAAALFCNQSFDPQAANHPRSAPLGFGAVLRSTLRLVGSGGTRDGSYSAAMSGLAEAIDGLSGPNYIANRLYSWWGMASVQSQAQAQVLLLLAAVEVPAVGAPAATGMSPGLTALLLPPDDRDRRRLQEHLNEMTTALDGLDAGRGSLVVGTLRRQPCSGPDYVDRVTAGRRILEQCKATIQAARQAAIEAAVTDPTRLLAVAAAAAKPLSREAVVFPASLFREVRLTDATLKRATYRIQVPRGDYTAPLLGDLPADENWWAQTTAPWSSALLFHDSTATVPVTRRRRTAPQAWWRACKDAVAAVQAAGQTPIIVRWGGYPLWLARWEYESSGRPTDLVITREPKMGPGFDFYLSGTPMFQCPGTAGATWVFGRELFDTAEFHRFPNGLAIDVGFERDPADPWRGVVTLELQHRVIRPAGPVWRIEHSSRRATKVPGKPATS